MYCKFDWCGSNVAEQAIIWYFEGLIKALPRRLKSHEVEAPKSSHCSFACSKDCKTRDVLSQKKAKNAATWQLYGIFWSRGKMSLILAYKGRQENVSFVLGLESSIVSGKLVTWDWHCFFCPRAVSDNKLHQDNRALFIFPGRYRERQVRI